MTGTQTAVMVTAFVVIDLFVITVVLWGVAKSAGLGELAAKHPPVTPAPGAVRRRFQSFSFGMLNLGGCIHVTVDEHHLHLDPAWFARALARMRPMSIPWTAIRSPKPDGRSWRGMRATIDGVDVRGPKWCLEMASPQNLP